jgi:hypothetical protein
VEPLDILSVAFAHNGKGPESRAAGETCRHLSVDAVWTQQAIISVSSSEFHFLVPFRLSESRLLCLFFKCNYARITSQSRSNDDFERYFHYLVWIELPSFSFRKLGWPLTFIWRWEMCHVDPNRPNKADSELEVNCRFSFSLYFGLISQCDVVKLATPCAHQVDIY